MKRKFAGEHAHNGDKMLVKDGDSKLSRDGIHAKLAHKHWTGPWQVRVIEQPGLRYEEILKGRRIRGTVVPAANINIFHERPERLCL